MKKESHITDRISKAVEQLGAEKTVDWIGRSVTIWTGEPERTNYDTKRAEQFIGKPRTKVSPKEWDASWNPDTEEMDESYRSTFATWPDERVVIQRQGEELELGPNETIGKEGKWQVFSETEPNIEVRIGGLLSLERIAQDSTRYDKGRDHVRVMEILCAYVRENARVGSLASEADDDEPRTMRNDVQIALDVIKRRDFKQTKIEQVAKYRLDLRNTDFRSADLSQGNFRGALMFSSRFEFADLRDADFSAALFHKSVLNFVYAHRARFVAADMTDCRIDKPKPVPGGFVRSINLGDVSGLSLAGANITALDYLGDPAQPTFGTKDTILSEDLHDQRQEAISVSRQISKAKRKNLLEELETLKQQIADNPFAQWSPFDRQDMSTNWKLSAFRQSLSLTGWPYDDN